MKIILLHGDYVKKSLERLRAFEESAKDRGWKIERIEPNSSMSMSETLSSTELFGGEKLFVVDRLQKMKPSELSWLGKKSDRIDATLIIFNDGALSATIKRKLPKNTVVTAINMNMNIPTTAVKPPRPKVA